MDGPMPLPRTKHDKSATPGPTEEPQAPKKRRGENVPQSRGVPNKKDDKKSKGRRAKPESDKPDDPEEPEERHSIVGDTVDKYLPGASKYMPDWAKPIVYDVKKRAVDPDAVEAFLADDGTLVVHAVLDPSKKGGHKHYGIFAAFQDEPAEKDGIELVLTVEDPSHASLFNPTTVTTVAVTPDSPEPVTNTAEVYSPKRVDKVAERTVNETVKDATAESAPAV
ncbi:hypothetical protein [Streptomyces sp. Da 82-17]|uniref:hypothetical protein n=1 Tax=Streptomyces sp. Da 82-17 TaxID=3377116 RepID=UPI0038D40927